MPAAVQRSKELAGGVNTLLIELSGLNFSRDDVKQYVRLAKLPPAGYAGFELARAGPALDQVFGGVPVEDLEALEVVNQLLLGLWRWRRRRQGVSTELRPYEEAIMDLQGGRPAVTERDMNRLSSSLLDNLPISEGEKQEIGTSVQKAAMAGINSFVWGGIVFTIGGLILFNFARGGGS